MRIPGNTRIVLDEIPADMPIVVLVFDERCQVVSPWPWSGSPNVHAGIAAVIGEGGDVSYGSDEPSQIQEGIKDGKAENTSDCR